MNRRILVIAIAATVLLVGGVVGVWAWLRRGARPMIEVIVDEAPVQLGKQVLATVSKGERLRIYGKQLGWYQVRVPGGRGQLAWIAAAHVRRILPEERLARKEVQLELLGVYFPDIILQEHPPWGKRWVLVEVNVFPLKGDAENVCPVDTRRFVLTYGKQRFFRPRLWKTIPLGDHTIDRLEGREVLDVPLGSAKRLRLAFAVPSECATHTGWRIHYVRFKSADRAAAPATTAAPPGSSAP